jgi:UDP-2,3-diacylglucosamine pyrophosphatase LpxH
MNAERGAMRYRSIWISDVHLGTRGCQAEQLLDFLKHTESEHLYLVGDIIDLWRMRRSWAWRQAHNDVIQKLLRKARKGTRVMFIPGNHDEMFREFLNADFGQIEIRPEHVHVTRKGERFLVIHGDEFDAVVTYAKWLAVLGDWSYNTLLSINTVFNDVRRRLGYPYWSLSAYLKQKAKRAVEFIGRFEEALATEAARRGVDGVICGHIHKAEMRRIGDILYCNDGDWVESCTALVEHMNGELEILHWAEVRQLALVA